MELPGQIMYILKFRRYWSRYGRFIVYPDIYVCIYVFHFVFLVELVFELRALCLQSSHSTA
jgi:hypothetical protein